MQHLTSTIQRSQPEESPRSDGAASDARAWLLCRLRWEHHLAELRSQHERARTQLDRIAAQHEALGRHLTNAVHTGTFCSYTPERPTAWEL